MVRQASRLERGFGIRTRSEIPTAPNTPRAQTSARKDVRVRVSQYEIGAHHRCKSSVSAPKGASRQPPVLHGGMYWREARDALLVSDDSHSAGRGFVRIAWKSTSPFASAHRGVSWAGPVSGNLLEPITVRWLQGMEWEETDSFRRRRSAPNDSPRVSLPLKNAT